MRQTARALSAPLMLPTPGGLATRSMSYLDLINDFWRLRQEVPFSSVEADLYYYLLKVCNDLNWKNPFAQPNALLGATLGVSEKTLIAARNRLKQAGLIDFQSGQKRAPTVYHLLRLSGGKQPDTRKHPLSNTLENLQPIREVSDSVNGSVSGRDRAETLQTSIEVEEEKKRPLPPAPVASESFADIGDGWDELLAGVCAPLQQLKFPLTPTGLRNLLREYHAPAVVSVLVGMASADEVVGDQASEKSVAGCAMRWLLHRAKNDRTLRRTTAYDPKDRAMNSAHLPAPPPKPGQALTTSERLLHQRHGKVE